MIFSVRLYFFLTAGRRLAHVVSGALKEPDVPVDVIFSVVEMPGTVDGFGLSKWTRTNHPNVAGLKARHLFTHARLFSSLAASIQQTSPEHSANAVLDGPNNNPIVEQRQSLARSVQASTCLPSASAVRQDHPGAWPSWTLRALGHEGSKCWHPANRVATRNNRSGVPGGSNGVTVPLPGSSTANQRWPQPVPIVF